jgi:hypothetical protein
MESIVHDLPQNTIHTIDIEVFHLCDTHVTHQGNPQQENWWCYWRTSISGSDLFSKPLKQPLNHQEDSLQQDTASCRWMAHRHVQFISHFYKMNKQYCHWKKKAKAFYLDKNVQRQKCWLGVLLFLHSADTETWQAKDLMPQATSLIFHS